MPVLSLLRNHPLGKVVNTFKLLFQSHVAIVELNGILGLF